MLLEHIRAADVVVEVGVAAIDNRIAGRQKRDQRLDHLLGDIAGRQHDPYRARRLELADQLLDTMGRLSALASQLVDRPAAAIMRYHAVPTTHPALSHTSAHAPKSGNANVHDHAPSCR